MAIRLWPQDYERKDHITKAEKSLLRNAARNFKSGHFAVSIDPIGMSSESIKMGMYISPDEGLVSFSVNTGNILATNIESYKMYVHMVEDKIYERLLDSKMLIVRDGQFKTLKFPYKHIIIFAEEKIGKLALTQDQIKVLENIATLDFFRPLTSKGNEKTIDQLGIFKGIRKPYDRSFEHLSDLECRAIFERLAPEYTVVMSEIENVLVEEKHSFAEHNLRITGKELEYKTFFLDEYQVAQVNDMGTGHRVILANPGAGKSVLLLSKAFKFASLFKKTKVLLTCYNNNLADSYNFKRACANFGDNNNLFIMTFHKLVKKIYDEFLHIRTDSSIVSDEEVSKCIELIKSGKPCPKFRAIFIDEVQNFNPLYLELCHLLLEDGDGSTFLMAGDLNQAVRAKSRKGDVPWKQIKGVKLDFTGRVRYIEKNYRNSKDISEYILGMLTLMNNRLAMLELINSMEYEYNSFTMGEKSTVAMEIQTGINRMNIKSTVLSAIKEIVTTYHLSYSDIAVLFPVRQRKYLKYYFLKWLKEALNEADIPFSLIIQDDETQGRTRFSNANGVVVSTIESSLGLDFKAVILTGLYPMNYVFTGEDSSTEITSWSTIKNMTEEEQELVQSQMRSIYTACSRARDVLYVISDLKSGSPMEELISQKAQTRSVPTRPSVKPNRNSNSSSFSAKRQNVFLPPVSSPSKGTKPKRVEDHVKIIAEVIEEKKPTTIIVDVAKYPLQKKILGKTIGESFQLGFIKKTYKIMDIIKD